jgi:hypothetical protein
MADNRRTEAIDVIARNAEEVAEIPLTRGYVALVDSEDFARVAQFKWCVKDHAHTENLYAARRLRCADGSRLTQGMHQFLLPNVEVIDHANGNGLDNRRSNLRSATWQQNASNKRGLAKNNRSGYRGVSWFPKYQKWRAAIRVNRKFMHLGLFDNPLDAAIAFDRAAIEHFGQFAGHLNVLKETS